ncbi:hypothetical protein TGAM01_v205367 [Trichoderma gamsii]|uniref:Uncharacterized protein n=1 Tax=Trichoderma gamsii TaxID=398673 RepID=A0A2P4ZNR6_9HYPO|nr:hypothetical protein TGAM01_v205367 [Trichoderma gamsii]PON25930.1 hypothetical protein TGAM01_v205367 [Trichoderma gamsii]
MAAPKPSLRAVANCEVGRLLQQLGRLRAVPISNRDFDTGSRAEARSLSRLHRSSRDIRRCPAAAGGMEAVAVMTPASRDQVQRAPGQQNLRLDCRSAGHYSVNVRAPYCSSTWTSRAPQGLSWIIQVSPSISKRPYRYVLRPEATGSRQWIWARKDG